MYSLFIELKFRTVQSAIDEHFKLDEPSPVPAPMDAILIKESVIEVDGRNKGHCFSFSLIIQMVIYFKLAGELNCGAYIKHPSRISAALHGRA